MTEENPLDRLRILLKDVPHYLQLDDLIRIRSKKCKAILERLKSERDRPWEMEGESVRARNFISLLYFRLDQKEDAFSENSGVLEKYPTNITALVNKAYMKMTTGYEKEAMDTIDEVKKLMDLQNYSLLFATAQAEQAYFFSRIGPQFYTRSVELFQKAISQFPNEYLWKFGCALTCKRCLNMPKCVRELTPDRLKELCTWAVTYLSDIVISPFGQKLWARAWMELGDMYSLLSKPTYPLSPQIVEEVKARSIQISPEQCFDMALGIEGTEKDEFVLQRCGKFLRFSRYSKHYRNTLQECYTYLMMAYKIRPTSFCCDNLATVLFKMAENKIEPDGRVINVGQGRSQLGQQYNNNNTRNPRGQSLEFSRRDDVSSKTKTPTDLNPLADEFVPQRMTSRQSGTFRYAELQDNFRRKSDQQDHIESITNRVSNLEITATSSKRKFKKQLASPRKVYIYPENHPLLNKAVKYLEESIVLSEECNMSAQYTLGMMYRRLAKTELAVEQFRRIFSDSDCSLYHRTNAYEQAGFCLLDLCENPDLSGAQRQRHRDESKHMMRMAIEHAARLVAITPAMRPEDLDYWEAYPTLRQILANEETPENFKEIAHLCELIGNHRESLEFYEKLRSIDPEDIQVQSKIIETYMRMAQFDNAKTLLDILTCTSGGRRLMEQQPNLIYQVNLGIVRHLLRLSDISPNDKIRIRECCKCVFEHRHGTTSGEEEDAWDVFILDEPKQTNADAAALQSWLAETCGLSVTRNNEDAVGHKMSFHVEAEFITNSKCMIVVLGSDDTKRIVNLVSIALITENLEMIVPVLTCSRNLPAILKGRRPVTFDQKNPERLLGCFLSLLGFEYKNFEWLE